MMTESILLNRRITTIFVAIAILFTGCGEGDDEGDITPEDVAFIEQFTNGKSRDSQVSEWDCVNELDFEFSFAMFLDRTGVDTDFGGFIWEQEGPRRIHMEGAVDRELDDIGGVVSDGSGTLLFDEDIEGDSLGELETSCTLDSTPNETIEIN